MARNGISALTGIAVGAALAVQAVAVEKVRLLERQDAPEKWQRCPACRVCIFDSPDGGLVATIGDNLKKSMDGGRTWTVVAHQDAGHPANRALSGNILRLKDGRLMKVWADAVENVRTNKLRAANFYASFSDDEGASWKGRRVVAGGNRRIYVMNDRLLRLSSGRIVLPLSMHPNHLLDSGLETVGWVAVVFSDDEGQTWTEGKWLEPKLADQLCEPFVFERQDGSLKMLARTGRGYLYETVSADGGMTWSPERPTTLRQPLAPFAVRRDPYSGNLFVAWNNTFPGSKPQYPRSPLWLGVSRDDGDTWEPLLELEADPNSNYGYPAIHFTKDSILVAHYESVGVRTFNQRSQTAELEIVGRREIAAKMAMAATTLPEYDVVVCGAGPAGIGASIAAARNGLKTLVLELNGCVGGTSTSAALPFWLGAYRDSIPYKRMLEENIPYGNLKRDRRAVRGIFDELMAAIRDAGGGVGPGVVGQTAKYPGLDRLGCHDEFTFDIETGKRVMEQTMLAAGVHIRYYARVIGAKRSGDRVEGVSFVDKSGTQYVPAKVVIDCTGDADVVASAGFATYKGDRKTGQMTGAGIVAHMENIDSAALEKYLNEGNDPRFRPIIAKALKENPGADWPERLIIFPMVQDGVFMVNGGQSFYGYDGTDGESMTQLTIRARKRAEALVDLFRRYLPGGRNCRLRLTAPYPGVRETRRIVAERQLTEEDLLEGTTFTDVIALAGRHFDLARPTQRTSGGVEHIGVQTFGEKKVKIGVTAIPYRALLPKGADNLIVAGRCIGADGQAMGPCRIMSTCFATGQAAGTAAKFKIGSGKPFRDIDVAALRAALRAANCEIDPK